MNLPSFLFAGLLFVASAIPGYAGIVLTIDGPSGDVQIPTTGTVNLRYEVLVAADAGTQDTRGFTIPVDITPPSGKGVPTGVTITNILETNSPYGELPSGTNEDIGDSGDFSFTDGNFVGLVTLTTANISLFEFTLSIDSTATEGSSFDISLPSNNLFSYTDGNDAEIPTTFPSAIRVNLVAVPEPSATALLLGTACFGLLRRKRTQKSR